MHLLLTSGTSSKISSPPSATLMARWRAALTITKRIEALGLILLISLLIWRLMEHAMRTDLEARNTTVPGWDNKPTCRPTAYMMTWKFKGVIILCIGQQRHLARPLSPTQEAFLRALQVPDSCFTRAPGAG
jgi:hypothetical protein